jgi:hypothetical protein
MGQTGGGMMKAWFHVNARYLESSYLHLIIERTKNSKNASYKQLYLNCELLAKYLVKLPRMYDSSHLGLLPRP